jgi:hypothetical protein
MGKTRVDDRQHALTSYFLSVVLLSLPCAAPVPAPLSVPVPGLPLEATVPDSPPIIPVLVPFFVTSSPVPGAMTGAELGFDVVAAGALDGALVAGGTVVVTVFLSLQPRHSAANKTDEVRVIRNTF